jgi:hypothetical protein
VIPFLIKNIDGSISNFEIQVFEFQIIAVFVDRNMVIFEPRAAEDYVVILVRNFVKIKSSFVFIDINVSVYYTGNRGGYIFLLNSFINRGEMSMRDKLRRMACFLLIVA